MRIESIELVNYKGIRRVQCSDLAAHPLLLVSGKNGTGKSLVLEALTFLYSQRWNNPARVVGPFGEACELKIVVSLTQDEIDQTKEWARTTSGQDLAIANLVPIHYSFLRDGNIRQGSDHVPAADVLRNTEFQQRHSFASMQFLPSVRLLPGNQGMAVDPGVMDPRRIEQERISMLDQYLQTRQPASMSNIFTYLATADYVDLMASREHKPTSGEFDLLTSPFLQATGKAISPPTSQDDFSIRMSVTLPDSDISHGIGELSSGEQELLSLSYFVRRANAAGGVLLIDEPEQHLHPTLQAAMLSQVAEMSPGAQVLAVTHSVNMLSSVPSSTIYVMRSPTIECDSQLYAVGDDGSRLALISELGLTAGDLIQADFVIVVEGESDESLLKALYPIAVAKAAFVVAGDVNGVMKICESLDRVKQVVPYICVRDRDFLSDDARNALMEKFDNLFIWTRRMFENELIDLNLVGSVFARVGDKRPVEEIETLVRSLADDGDKNEVVLALVDDLLRTLQPAEPPEEHPKGVDRHRESYKHLARVAEERAQQFDTQLAQAQADVDARWNTDWLSIADGKRWLSKFTKKSPVKDPRAALAAAYVADETLRPPGLRALEQRLDSLVAQVRR